MPRNYLKIPHHPQCLDYTCVPACVRMVAHYHGIILSELKKWLALDLPCIVRIKTTHLPRYPLPPWVPHAVVIVGITGTQVFIHDPTQARYSL